jgi:hypothetical protein
MQNWSRVFSATCKLVLGAALGLAVGGASEAQSPAAPQVTVHVGPALSAKARKLGETDVDEMVKDLGATVRRDLQGHAGGKAPIRADLVLEDATPNRPTLQQLSDHPGLSERSIALGGAAVSGVVTFADGHTEPFSYTFREISLRDEIGVGQWTDADRAFEYLGDDLAHGRIPHDHLDIRVADSGFDQWRP